MKYDGLTTRPLFGNIVIEVSKEDRLVGYIWFKGKKIPVSANTKSITIPYADINYREDD